MTFNAVDNKLDTTRSLTIFSERQKDSLEANINLAHLLLEEGLLKIKEAGLTIMISLECWLM